MIETSIEQTVMRRVRLIRILALIISTATLAVLTSAAALWGIGREVWVAQVFQNMPDASNLITLLTFWLTAFFKTHLLVQILTLLTLASLIFLLREAKRFIAPYFTRG